MIPFLGPFDPFPAVESARDDMGGLLAVGGDLGPARLLDAYRHAFFPGARLKPSRSGTARTRAWCLFPNEFRLSRSLRKTLCTQHFEVRFDSNFAGVMAGCAETPRPGQDGTWITPDMLNAYIRLHELGWAHSVETYVEGDLAGGLYGLAIGRMFYGESMFSRRSDASKVAFAHLIRYLSANQFEMIDCQMRTEHLASLGGREIPRASFLARLMALTAASSSRTAWSAENIDLNW
jgi:leucyl/phenylalanyl-tRNA--protein transferase